ncbi:DUF3857 domain-containing protein [Aequorivita lipolytica]|uniref:DUF3857 domain-containing protein n=1 Tax=Aequorivita lipolytica TaxID=153267 RepID=A0A5C6YQ36_9FLAO|nr:DUF3857 domain-containing protein [Aequorivita lipolytica]TXD68984.1 DUF3857 domain-containing protein [Aequorivita lipolytica]SRX53003.1 hypothetical protein AEQU2_02263 [Aequorivita lipolytica]
MQLKNLLLPSCLIFVTSLFSQISNIQTFGEPLTEEIAMTKFPADPEANGVVLYKRGNYSVDEVGGYIMLIKEIHGKIKVIDAKNFKHSTIEIPYYREKNVREKVTNLKGITHNGAVKEYVGENAIFDTDETVNWSNIKFTFPNVQNGSILEYTYRIETPYFFNFGSWEFQDELPVLYSELHTEIPGNFSYNRTLFGNFPLAVNYAEIKKACFVLNGFDVPGDCESATYVMQNLPAFKEEEYMLSKKNYIPRMKYEVIEIVDLTGSKSTYTNTWEDVDKKFRYDKDLGRQLKYSDFFKEQLPAAIFTIPDALERAKAIYYYFQETMFWNKEYRILSDIRVKDAFESKTGNSSEINLGLINALEAAGLDAKIMLIASRSQPLPTKQYPVLTDFNYALVYLNINNTEYLLDATDKYNPFGVLPLRDLNMEGRVMDFKNGSYWLPIEPFKKNMHYVNMQLTADESGQFSGKVNEVSTGYISVEKRKKYNQYNLEEIIKTKQGKNESLNITNLEIQNEKDLEQPYTENFDISLHEQPVGDNLFIYPFLMQPYFSENPFKKETRQYPIDFGFPVTNNYLISFNLGNQYKMVQMPSSRILKLPHNDGEVSIVYNQTANKINIRLSVKLSNHVFAPEAYKSLREFFTELIKIQSEEPIQLKKI